MNGWLPTKWKSDPEDRMTAFPGRKSTSLRSALLSCCADGSTTPNHRQLIPDQRTVTKTHTVRSCFNQHGNRTHFKTLNRLHALCWGAELHRDAEWEKAQGIKRVKNNNHETQGEGYLMNVDQHELLHRSYSSFLCLALSYSTQPPLSLL